MRAQKREPVLPANSASHLTDWFFEIGPTSAEGPISWQEIAAWSLMTSIDLDPWEASLMRRLSVAYMNQREEARKPSCPEPRLQVDTEAARNRVEAQFSGMMSAIKAGLAKDERAG
ncbi:hypothetical protein HNO88_001577 [Novosphingobium chloroacetimidivorans]|uniref:Uncharacterized protein n=1 Tax=Novosphingobium chloroacetimidivorans TaxID=1428314 RepID=A0A7W7K9Z7_9SPHN|nr:hypothetical protein [Novosphingobium chloroacetimidivorans]MBB4858258.1 hypothetical protein [Novosphingobium chloroacetimidivorans]